MVKCTFSQAYLGVVNVVKTWYLHILNQVEVSILFMLVQMLKEMVKLFVLIITPGMTTCMKLF